MDLPIVRISVWYILAHSAAYPWVYLCKPLEKEEEMSAVAGRWLPVTDLGWLAWTHLCLRLKALDFFSLLAWIQGALRRIVWLYLRFMAGVQIDPYVQNLLMGDEDYWCVCLRHVSLDGVCTRPWSLVPVKKPSCTAHASSLRDQLQKEVSFPLRRLWLLLRQISTSCCFLKEEILQDFLSVFSSSAPAQQLEVRYFKLLYQCDQHWV